MSFTIRHIFYLFPGQFFGTIREIIFPNRLTPHRRMYRVESLKSHIYTKEKE